MKTEEEIWAHVRENGVSLDNILSAANAGWLSTVRGKAYPSVKMSPKALEMIEGAAGEKLTKYKSAVIEIDEDCEGMVFHNEEMDFKRIVEV